MTDKDGTTDGTTIGGYAVRTEPPEGGIEGLRSREFPQEQRRLGGIMRYIVSAATIFLAVFTIQMAFRVTYGPVITTGIHLVFAIPLVFLVYPASRSLHDRPIPWYDYVLAASALAAFLWALLNADRWENRMAYSDDILPGDIIFGIVAVVTVFEATRRTVGITIVGLTLIFMAYAFTGPLWPGLFEHRGVSLNGMVEHLYMLPEGLFNFITGIIATFLFTFLAFGVFLKVSGGDTVFTDLALAVAGNRRGGPAKVAIISSSLMGTLSGSTISNVVTTGSLTIPLMKKTGFKPYQAAAIESVASLGGALMPPVMGAGVFIMAAFTGVPLNTILAYSILPAILYYTSLYFSVDMLAAKAGLKGMPRETLPKAKEVMLQGGHIFLPICVLIYFLVMDYSAFFASSVSVIVVFLGSWLRSHTRMTPGKLLVALEATTRLVISLSPLTASAAIIYGVATATGLIVKISSIIMAASGGIVVLAIIYLGIMSYVLGMGLPVTASYVLVAALGAPALADLGVPILASHLVLFWFSQYATITPPICMTAFVAARIADAPPMKTGWSAALMGKAIYIVPFMFVYGSLLSTDIVEVLFDFCVLFAALAIMPAATGGFYYARLSYTQRIAIIAAGVGWIGSALGPMVDGLPYCVASMGLFAVAALDIYRRRVRPVLAARAEAEVSKPL